MNQTNKRRITTQMITILGVLVALEIILSRFCSYSVWNMKIGFNFIPIVVAGTLFGPLAGGIVGALGDFLGAVLFPIAAYFPGYTLTAFLTGTVFGLFLHKRRSLPRILCAVAVNQLILSLFLQTLWISIQFGAPYTELVLTRTLQCVVMIAIQLVTIPAMDRVLTAPLRRVLA